MGSIKMASVYEQELEAEYRFVVDGRQAKYVRIEAGVFSDTTTLCCEDYLLPLLPKFPSGDWNDGVISSDQSGQPFFSHVAKVEFPAVKSIWHTDMFDLLSLKLYTQGGKPVGRLLSPQLFDFPVIAKFTNYPDEVYKIEAETALYKVLEGTGIGPRFLGHLTENGRVMGFLMERIEGRAAKASDFDACRSALFKLHEKGIKHGDVNRANFVVKPDGQAELIDFSEVQYNASSTDLAEEICELRRQLDRPPGAMAISTFREDGTLVSIEDYKL